MERLKPNVQGDGNWDGDFIVVNDAGETVARGWLESDIVALPHGPLRAPAWFVFEHVNEED